MTETTWVLILIGALMVINLIVLITIYSTKKNQDNGISSEKIDWIIKQNQDAIIKTTEKNGELKEHLSNVIASNNRNITEDFIRFSDKMMKSLDEQVEKLNKKVEEKLGDGFQQTNQTFSNVVERLTRIDEAQKQIEKLSYDVVALNDILIDKKNRGTFGEVQLKQIFVSIFGENKPSIYEMQKQLSNQTVVDVLLKAPEPMGHIAIDSKFPLENYRKMVDASLSESAHIEAEKSFKADVKKHIDAISTKYIISGETSNQAIMFIPAEAIFSEINARHDDLISYAQSKHVWFTSPTTLMSTLTIVQMILKDIQRSEFSKLIQNELSKLSVEFERYQDRWEKLLKNIGTVSKQAEQVQTTTEKITKRFKSISNVDEINLNRHPEEALEIDIDDEL